MSVKGCIKIFSKKKHMIALAVILAMALLIIDFCIPNYLRQTAERLWLFVAVPVQRFDVSLENLTPYTLGSVIFQVPEKHSYIFYSQSKNEVDDNNSPENVPCRLMSFSESQKLRSQGDHWSDRFSFAPMIGGRVPGEHVPGSVLRNRYRVVGGVRGVETVELFPIMETEAKDCQAISLYWCGNDDSEGSGKLITIGGGKVDCVTATDWPEIVAQWDVMLDKATPAPRSQ